MYSAKGILWVGTSTQAQIVRKMSVFPAAVAIHDGVGMTAAPPLAYHIPLASVVALCQLEVISSICWKSMNNKFPFLHTCSNSLEEMPSLPHSS